MVQPKYITRWQAETPSAENGGNELAFVHQKTRPLRGGLATGDPTATYDPFEHTNSEEFPWKLNQ
jgi:hypothetical protein